MNYRLVWIWGIFSLSFLFAKCNFGSDVLYLLAKIEKHPQREIGYPYIISFNETQELSRAKIDKYFPYKKLDDRSIDCLNDKNCQKILNFLNRKNLINLDLGAFQINMKWHKYESKKYFSLRESSEIVCNILDEIVKRERKWSWSVLATYHSQTKQHNEKYKRKLILLSKEM